MLNLGDVVVEDVQLANLCRLYQVRELSLFGSAARGEMRPDSDIDVLVEYLPNAEVGLVEHAADLYLKDVVEAADHITAFLGATDLEGFRQSEVVRSRISGIIIHHRE